MVLFINKYIEKKSPLEKMPGLIVKVIKCFYVEVVRAQYKRIKNKVITMNIEVYVASE